MPNVLKSVSYSYLEGTTLPYALDAIVIEGGEVRLDVHKKFETLSQFYEEISQVVPMFERQEEGDPISMTEGDEL